MNQVQFGKRFENIFFNSCVSQSGAVSRMPDGCRVVGKNKLVRVKTAFDWILTYQGRSAFIDTKSSSFDHFRVGDIKEHQLRELCAHESAGAIAGYIVELRPINKVYFINAKRLEIAFKTRKSIHDDIVLLGDTSSFSPWDIFKQH